MQVAQHHLYHHIVFKVMSQFNAKVMKVQNLAFFFSLGDEKKFN